MHFILFRPRVVSGMVLYLIVFIYLFIIARSSFLFSQIKFKKCNIFSLNLNILHATIEIILSNYLNTFQVI